VSETWTPLKLIAWTQGYLTRSGVDAPRLTAELLLAHALSCDRVRLYLDFDKPLGPAELAAYRELVRRRAEGEPTAYLTGTREFWGRAFRVDSRVLVPRPETELLVEPALAALPPGGAALDLCTGSGVLGVTIALERPGARVVATDISRDALDVAQANATRLGASVGLRQGDLFEAVASMPFHFDVIVANPPYVPSAELSRLAREIQREPSLALDGGPDGLSIIRRIAAGAPDRLVPGGTLIVEIHESHAEEGPRLCLAAGMASAEAHRDLAGLPRYLVARTAGDESRRPRG
jgi:release factor glutamine methyltransferase